MTKERVRTTGDCSRKFGPCEVCSQHASEVFKVNTGSHVIFGHKECLEAHTDEELIQKQKEFNKSYHNVKFSC